MTFLNVFSRLVVVVIIRVVVYLVLLLTRLRSHLARQRHSLWAEATAAETVSAEIIYEMLANRVNLYLSLGEGFWDCVSPPTRELG